MGAQLPAFLRACAPPARLLRASCAPPARLLRACVAHKYSVSFGPVATACSWCSVIRALILVWCVLSGHRCHKRSETADSFPKAATCYQKLYMPQYTSQAVMAEKLQYAIANCMAIDTDG
jgi:hypothetical protein